MKGINKRIVMLCALLLLPFISRASCQFYYDDVTSEVAGYLTFGAVVVQRDTPVGAVIATATTGPYINGRAIAGCDEPWTLRWEFTRWRVPVTVGNKIYRTNLAGVGIRLTNTDLGEVLPYTQERGDKSYVVIRGDGIKGELIKTGEITSGNLLSGVLARGTASNQFYFANVTLNGTNAISVSGCTVDSPSIAVPLNDHSKRDFSGRGSGTAWRTFNIDLDCNWHAKIHIRIDATLDKDAEATNVMALDPDPGAATGVGVQLAYQSGLAVEFGKSHFYRLSAGGKEAIPLQARYYQTQETIKAGLANATATFTLTYR